MADDTIDLTAYNGDRLMSTVTVFLVLSWIAVGLRTYTRAWLMKNFQLDDWFMLLGQATFSTYAGFLYAGISDGIGTHNAAITDDQQLVMALKWQALAIAFYILEMMFIKLSIGIFLLRIASQAVYVWILRISLVIISVWSTVIFFWNIFQCDPVPKQWDYRIETGKCVPPEALVMAAYALSAMTIVSDWLYALLPIPMVWNVRMSKQAKVTVILILGLGIFASVATLVRLRYLPDMANLEDVLYAGTDAMVWTIIEPGLAIVASSLATIRPLLRAWRIRGFESSDDATDDSRRSGGGGAQLPPFKREVRPSAKVRPGQYGIHDIAITTLRSQLDQENDHKDNKVFVTHAQISEQTQEGNGSEDEWRRSEGATSMDSLCDLGARNRRGVYPDSYALGHGTHAVYPGMSGDGPDSYRGFGASRLG
ncbi:uncharacterized protein J7T54_002067 [Emericellopsis cladophorae]|uniref:Rhodopsin domain-containing protein n=1 Tax=Emericellopsis cladophorae TaxID=2686198 RepID=A0A9P9Y3F1_9HYPO|nr:uncharacterized protein J7T54_002067 [Emericellopsis cladophorae]KAI6782908.1 hypothetical protein J7T54_002067 [Emericellopsis cladophorae]